RYAVELRNANYLTDEYFEFLRRNKLGHVFLQGYWMPDISTIYHKGRDAFLECEQVVIRLHGGDRKEIEEKAKQQWNKIVEPRDKELLSVTNMIKDLLNNEVDVYLNINNHYEGSAPLTIDRIRALLAV
ncbi:MAG: DUF72 domain-containing protein, partial [Candidatus Eisenbacteria bacterium]|nr:DUF72 domain-containing protein [Candidatus Eisenbacteria bacterium]